MVKQYPHTILVEWEDSPVFVEGNPVKGEPHTFTSQCRAEMNGSGKSIPSINGSLIVYAYSVYMPKTTGVQIPFGAKAKATIDGSAVTGSVKGFKPGQLNSVLWL